MRAAKARIRSAELGNPNLGGGIMVTFTYVIVGIVFALFVLLVVCALAWLFNAFFGDIFSDGIKRARRARRIRDEDVNRLDE